MSVYIIRPKATVANRFPSLAERKTTTQTYQAQVKEVAELWQEDPTYQKIRRWVDNAQNRGVNLISTNAKHPTITGTTIVDMPEREAEDLRRNEDIIILKDEQIELIRPIQDASTAKAKLTSKDIWHLQAIAGSAARQSGYKNTGKNVKIAVFDTGIEPNHPELLGKVAESYTLNFRRDVSQGRIEQTTCQDTDGHGTHVAGLICGNTVGVAPEAQLINVMMLPKGLGSLVNFITALEWLLERPDVRIVNISAGLFEGIKEMSYLIDDLLSFGILPICAVGNDGRNKTRSPGNCSGAISVGATDGNGQVAGFSSSGKIVIDHHTYNVPSLVAPGAGVYSSVMGGGYEAWNGTSMATPIVSGVAALLLEENPSISVYELKEELLNRCQSLGHSPERQGAGIIQVAR